MIFITGDTHGTVPFGLFSIDGISRRLNTDSFPEQKEMTRDDYVMIAGDFGCVWNYDSRFDPMSGSYKDRICLAHGESKEEKHWLDWLNEKPFTTVFCDGNHENFDRLDHAYPEVDFHGGKAHKIRENVYHLMRGYVFDLDGCKIFVFGGAQSHDISGGIVRPYEFKREEDLKQHLKIMNRKGAPYRVDRMSWWERELPSPEEMDRGIRNLDACGNKVDYIVSHCAPQQIAAVMGYYEENRLVSYFNVIAETVQFSRWFFGHYHDNRQIMVKWICLYDQITRIW